MRRSDDEVLQVFGNADLIVNLDVDQSPWLHAGDIGWTINLPTKAVGLGEF